MSCASDVGRQEFKLAEPFDSKPTQTFKLTFPRRVLQSLVMRVLRAAIFITLLLLELGVFGTHGCTAHSFRGSMAPNSTARTAPGTNIMLVSTGRICALSEHSVQVKTLSPKCPKPFGDSEMMRVRVCVHSAAAGTATGTHGATQVESSGFWVLMQ